MRFIIEQGYIGDSNAWINNASGNLYAVVKLDENDNQISAMETVPKIKDIPIGEIEVNLVETLPNGKLKFYPSRKRSFEMVEGLYTYALALK